MHALRGLLDIDDGTIDGNTRVNLVNDAEDLGAVMGGNGRIDGRSVVSLELEGIRGGNCRYRQQCGGCDCAQQLHHGV